MSVEPFDAVDVIRIKRDGGVVPEAALRWLIDAYTRGYVSDAQMASFAMGRDDRLVALFLVKLFCVGEGCWTTSHFRRVLKESMERIEIQQPACGNPEAGCSQDYRMGNDIAWRPETIDQRETKDSKGPIHDDHDE